MGSVRGSPNGTNGSNCTIGRANGTIGIVIGTNGITNDTIGKTLNEIGIPLVPLGNPEHTHDKFQMKCYDSFLIFAQNIDCGCSLEPSL